MMKRTTVLLLTISTVLCLASGPLRAQQPAANSQRVPTEQNTLIVYLSRTNYTKAIAEIIHREVGGTLVALELETPHLADYRSDRQFCEAEKCNSGADRSRVDFGAEALDRTDPGTTKLHRFEENLGATAVERTPDAFHRLKEATAAIAVQGARYSEGAQKMIDRR